MGNPALVQKAAPLPDPTAADIRHLASGSHKFLVCQPWELLLQRSIFRAPYWASNLAVVSYPSEALGSLALDVEKTIIGGVLNGD
jgi:hypothetical protein